MRNLWRISALILAGNANANLDLLSTSSVILPASTSGSVTSFVPKPSLAPTSTSDEPCAIVSRKVDKWVSLRPSVPTPVIDAEVAYRCLKSVPIVKSDALQLISKLKPYFGFQSTVGYLKKPPQGYLLPGVDLLDGLAKIEGNVRNDHYNSEVDFQADVFQLARSVHDGHFSYFPDALTEAFEFNTRLFLISISKDGHELPQVYVTTDVLGQGKNRAPSPVVSINGQDAATYLQIWSVKNSNEQDPDALYNKLFPGIARNLGSLGSTFTSFNVYSGPSTTLTFANGTSITNRNVALVKKNFKGVNSGQSFYSKFCHVPIDTTSTLAKRSATSQSPVPPPSGYPSAIARHDLNLVAGYDLKSSKNPDVAVLAVPSFDTIGKPDQAFYFQETVEGFLAKAKAQGKTKLIIDLQSNTGGLVDQGHDLFMHLFPHLLPYNAVNLRATPDLDLVGQGVSDLVKKYFNPQSDPSKIDSSDPINVAASLPYNYRHDLKTDGHSTYTSWSDFFGPKITPYDSVTNLFRENLTDPFSESSNGFVMGGTLDRATLKQPFAAENIILLYDGICHSTCAIFSELMKTQVGVRSIVVGGRPQYAPMQGIGGTKGSRVYDFDFLLEVAQGAYSKGSTEYQAQVNKSPSKLTSYPIKRASDASFNHFNNIRIGDDSLTPLQFVYEAADCRLFYTKEMFTDISFLWDRVADVAFGSAPHFSSPYCVRNSTGHPSAEPNVTDYSSYAPPPGARCRHCGHFADDAGRNATGNSTTGNSTTSAGAVPSPTYSTTSYSSAPASLATPSLPRGVSPAVYFLMISIALFWI